MKHHIIHDTIFHYDNPVSESIMEVRLHPRDDERQRCQRFALTLTPKAPIHHFVDALGNHVHHFNIPNQLTSLIVRAEAIIEVWAPPALPAALAHTDWDLLRERAHTPLLDMLLPSRFTASSAALLAFMQEHQLNHEHDPLTTVRNVAQTLYNTITYSPQATTVDSTIDEVLDHRQGVCQDITHLMIAICRQLGIPSRYVSGYLYHRRSDHDRSQADATHAWLEVWLPGLDWIGIDPTNNIWAGERHICVALGRDYADVPPTRGVYRGPAHEHLEVAVTVNDVAGQHPLPNAINRPQWPANRVNTHDLQQQQQQQ